MRKAVLFGVGLLLLLAGVAGVGAALALREIDRPGPLTEDRILVIERGSGLVDISEQLAADGVVRHAPLFLAAAKLDGSGRALRAGEYRFPAGISVAGALDLLREGRTFVRSITIPEGLTVSKVMALVEAEPALAGAPGDPPPEGSLLPDTYHFSRGDTRAGLIRRMRDAMGTFLGEAWADRDPGIPLQSRDEAVVLASIVEKETGVADERQRVAGVFYNRLKAGMRLQSDPTVVYALSGGTGHLGRALTRADWQVASPYNTYQTDGLPPAPIANPGRDSIRAVLHPENHKFLYFVADGSGGHAFAATLDEHNRNVAEWRRVRRQTSETPE